METGSSKATVCFGLHNAYSAAKVFIVAPPEVDVSDYISELSKTYKLNPIWYKDVQESNPNATRAELAETIVEKLSGITDGFVIGNFPQTRAQACMVQERRLVPTHVVIITGDNAEAMAPLIKFYPNALNDPADPAAVVRLCGAAPEPTMRPLGQQRVFVIGPPGSGVGTIAARLAREPDVEEAITVQQLVYREVSAATPAGRTLHPYLTKKINHRGEIDYDVDVIDLSRRGHDELIAQVAAAALEKLDGWAVYGSWPENMNQFKLIRKIGVEPTRMLIMDCSDEVCLDRLTARRVNPDTGVVVHPADPEWRPEFEEFSQRPEDSVYAVKQRLAAYKERTMNPAALGKIAVVVDAEGTRDEVTTRVMQQLRAPVPN